MKTGVKQIVRRLSPSSSFRIYLQSELARRCSNNPQYSLRSFALQLEIDHSTLSQILRGKRGLTRRMIERLGAKLELDAAEINSFAEHEHASTEAGSRTLRERRRAVMDAASLVSEPSHYAILELIRVDGFQPDSRWIARTLDLTVDDVNLAVSRLLRFGLLEMAGRNCWIDRTESLVHNEEEFAAFALQKLANQLRQSS